MLCAKARNTYIAYAPACTCISQCVAETWGTGLQGSRTPLLSSSPPPPLPTATHHHRDGRLAALAGYLDTSPLAFAEFVPYFLDLFVQVGGAPGREWTLPLRPLS